jgi:hypothetical protein
MRVVRVADPGVDEPAVQLVDGNGEIVGDVSAFLRLLTVRRFSPNTVRAYAHDLQKLMLFLDERGLTMQDFAPARAVDFLATLRHTPSNQRAQRLDLAATVDGGRFVVRVDLQSDTGGGLVVLRVLHHLRTLWRSSESHSEAGGSGCEARRRTMASTTDELE